MNSLVRQLNRELLGLPAPKLEVAHHEASDKLPSAIERHKARAAQHGLDWKQVRREAKQLRDRWHHEHDHLREIRMELFSRYGNGGAFKLKYREQLAHGDYDAVPGFDGVAQELAGQFSELNNGPELPAEKLWNLVKRPEVKPPRMDRLYQQAIDELAR